MHLSLGLLTPLWIIHENADLLERALGEIGPDHLTLLPVSGPQHLLRPHQQPHLLQVAGGWHYPPDPAAYAGCGLRPPKSHWFGKRNTLQRLLDIARTADIPVAARVELPAAGLTHAHPHLAQRNAWGEANTLGPACPLHPEVRALLEATLADLNAHGIKDLQLAEWDMDCAADGLDLSLDWDADLARLMQTCFCPACRQVAQSAGLDAEATAAEARERLESGGADELALLDDYCEVRRADALRWLEQLATHLPDGRRFLLQRFDQRSEQSALTPMVDLRSAPAPLQLDTWFRNAPAVNLPSWHPWIEQPDALVRTVTHLQKQGVEWIDFDGLEAGGDQAIPRIRHAVRFAQRQ